MITPKDIENPSRRSGYDFVHFSAPKGTTQRKPYQGIACTVPGSDLPKMDNAGRRWRGPRRATALESAQDYCNLVNGLSSTPQVKLKTAGHTKVAKADRQVSPKRAVAYELLKEAANEENTDMTGYIYCISDGTAMKIGMSIGHPQNRMASLQTGNPRLLKLLAYKEVPNRVEAELALHTKYQKHNILGEWFKSSRKILKEFAET